MKRAGEVVLIALVASFIASASYAQGVSIGNGAAGPDNSALLELNVSGMVQKKGLLIPRMTESEKLEIGSPALGLLVYQTNGSAGFYYYDGVQWVAISGDDFGDHLAQSNINMDGNWVSGDGDDEGIVVDTDGHVGIGIAEPVVNLHAAGPVRINNLSGSGARMVVADANGQLTTQPIPTPGPGAGTTMYLDVTDDISNLDVSGVSFIHVTSDHNNNEINGLVGGILNQVIYLINTSNRDLKFTKNTGTQQFIQDFDLKKEEGGMIMFSGSRWHVISKH